MGGYGSGRYGYRRKAEHTKSLDVNRLHREGCLVSGRQGHWVWWQNEEETARIAYAAERGRLVLRYRVSQHCGEWEDIEQTIPLTQAHCHYDGARPYFTCNGVVNGRYCGRRVCKLFMGGKYFLCRHCYRISYASQSEARYDRMLRRANKLRVALGGEPGTANPVAPKPKGMWWRTYERKLFEIEWCEHQADRLFIAHFAHLLSEEERQALFMLES